MLKTAMEKIGYRIGPSNWGPNSWMWYNAARTDVCQGLSFDSEQEAFEYAIKDARLFLDDIYPGVWNKLDEKQQAKMLFDTLFLPYTMNRLAAFGPGGQHWDWKSKDGLIRQVGEIQRELDGALVEYRAGLTDSLSDAVPDSGSHGLPLASKTPPMPPTQPPREELSYKDAMAELDEMLQAKPLNVAANLMGNAFFLRKESLLCAPITSGGSLDTASITQPDESAWDEHAQQEFAAWLAKPEFVHISGDDMGGIAKELGIEPQKTTRFSFQHMSIHNPMLSECGRFEVEPSYYGFVEITTGGGCMAWQKMLEDGGYLLLTDEGGVHLPKEGAEAIIGRYDRDGDTVVEAHKLTFEPPEEREQEQIAPGV